MTKYRKKPVEIEAVQMPLDDGTMTRSDMQDRVEEIAIWIAGHSFLSEDDFPDFGSNYLQITTLEGTMNASPGDFIIRGVQGEFYPCKPDIFDATYEKVSD